MKLFKNEIMLSSDNELSLRMYSYDHNKEFGIMGNGGFTFKGVRMKCILKKDQIPSKNKLFSILHYLIATTRFQLGELKYYVTHYLK